MKAVRACAFLVLLVGLAGCSTSKDVQADNDKLCEELAKMDGSVTQLAALDPNTASVQQVRDLKTRIDVQYRQVQKAAKDASSFRTDAVARAYNDLSKSVATVNSQAALANALPQINQAAGELSDARLELNSTAGC